MSITDLNMKQSWLSLKVLSFIKVKFRGFLAVIRHCQSWVDCKIPKHCLTRFGCFWVLSTNYRESIVCCYQITPYNKAYLSYSLFWAIFIFKKSRKLMMKFQLVRMYCGSITLRETVTVLSGSGVKQRPSMKVCEWRQFPGGSLKYNGATHAC